MRGIIPNKRGDAMSILIFLAIAFTAIVILIFMTKVFNDVTTVLKNTTVVQNDTKALTQINKVSNSFVPLMGNAFIFLFFASIFGIIISSLFINTHPGFFIIFLIVTIVTIVLAGILSNVINEFGSNPALISTYTLYPAVQAIVNNLPLIILITSAIVAIILFSRSGGNTQI